MYSPVQGGEYRYYDHLKQKKAGELINISVGLLLSEMVVPVIPDILKILVGFWICPYISRHLLSLNPLLACCRRYSRGER